MAFLGKGYSVIHGTILAEMMSMNHTDKLNGTCSAIESRLSVNSLVSLSY